jgi:hypothetical protein
MDKYENHKTDITYCCIAATELPHHIVDNAVRDRKGLNLRTLDGPARGPFGPTQPEPEIYLKMFPIPHPSPTSLYSIPNEARSIYNLH